MHDSDQKWPKSFTLTLGHTLHTLADLWEPLWVNLRVPKWPHKKQKQHKETETVVLDHFSQKNGPNDLVRSLFLS
jgi:hypothetical protein